MRDILDRKIARQQKMPATGRVPSDKGLIGPSNLWFGLQYSQ